jgi:hypothetical protein
MAKGNRWTQSTTCKSNLSLTNILYCRIDHLFWIKVYYSLPTSSQTISLRTCVGSPGQRCVQKCWTHVRNSLKLPVSRGIVLPSWKDSARALRVLATTWGCLLPCERLATLSISTLLILCLRFCRYTISSNHLGHFASLKNHLGHFASLKNHLLVAQVSGRSYAIY